MKPATNQQAKCTHPKKQRTLIVIGGFAGVEFLNVKCQCCHKIIDQIIKT